MQNDKFEKLGVKVPELLLPKEGTDMTKWSVVACDQYTSQPEYWDEVEKIVGEAPSTFRITLPEIFLESPYKSERIKKIHTTMAEYLSDGVFENKTGAIYTERTVGGSTRAGLIIALDLEQYDFKVGSQSLIRATEGTVLDRIPPRVEIRDGAPLESPHIMVLIDDPKLSVIESLSETKNNAALYDFDLMMKGGHVAGWTIDDAKLDRAFDALGKLADRESFGNRYGAGEDKGILLFAMGDGNHSLATAKTVWEMKKKNLPADHPLRYALVEIVNVHSPAIVFEPIHRVVFGVTEDIGEAARSYFDGLEVRKVESEEAMEATINSAGNTQQCGYIDQSGYYIWTFTKPTSQLAVGTLQAFLDKFAKESAEKIDYIHGTEEVCAMGGAIGNCGFFLPRMDKNDLFKTVIFDGALPRKTFSMGEAHEKRFYLECRSIA